jgi:putative spermidine/putrescine transport system ATP-binding protein
MTVAKNIEFPLIARKVPTAERRRRVTEILELVRLPQIANRSVRSLSGGQQQRVALARALVFQPRLLLLDEPLAALDKQLREAMQLELKRIQLETGTTTIAVTHDQVEAMSMADAVAIMNGGRVIQVGTPEEVYRRPADLFVATFLGEANLLPVENGQVRTFGLPAPGEVADPVAVVRPEDVQVVDEQTAGAVCVQLISEVFQGTRRRLTVQAPGIDQAVVVSAPPQLDIPTSGEHTVFIRLPAAEVHLVSGTGEVAAAAADAAEIEPATPTELIRR